MIFFTDENFIHQANALLRAFDLENTIRAFLDCFHKGTPDVDWLRRVGRWEEKPVIVGGDGRILTNQVERAALRESGCSFVYLSSGWTSLPWNVFALRIIKHWPAVVELAKRTTKQGVLELTVHGNLQRKSLPG